MIRRGLLIPVAVTAIVFLVGCGGDSGPKVELATAVGTVKYKGAPLAGATVMFIPAAGPVAMGFTDLEGKFNLMTGALKGVAVGDCKVTITAVQGGDSASAPSTKFDTSGPPASPEEGYKRMQQFQQMQKDAAKGGTAAGASTAKSLIPEKYAKPESSGLTKTVSSDSSKNRFDFDIPD